MKLFFRRFTALLLVLALCLSLCACGTSEKEKDGPYITDANGRKVYLTDDPSTATAASVYAVSTPFFLALDITDRVLAVNTKKAFLKKQDEGLSKAGNVGNGVVDLEKLASYGPSVLVHRSNDDETVEAVEKIGIDVICITVENMDDVKSTLRMLGTYFGAEERAEYVCSWIDEKFAMIDEIVAKIPEEERVTALLMGGELGRVAGNDMLQSWMIEKAGGKCVADIGKDHNWIDAGVEKIFTWNPDYIFCTSSTARDYTTQELLEDSSWDAVQAVIDENIYIIPATQDSWDMPGISPVLGTLYMLYCMYPDYFSREELETQIDEYYTFMFGKTYDEETLGYELP